MIPVNNFTAIFSKLDYIVLKTILDKNSIVYNKYTIIQAFDMKKVVEEMNINKQ